MKIDTLVKDIYALFGSGKEVKSEDVDDLSCRLANHITAAFKKRDASRSLRASNLGVKCDRKSWYLHNAMEKAEEVEPWVKLKFLFGHLHEELVLFFAKEAGHDVQHRQDTIVVDDVEGHPDAVIDGVIVDVKSANSRGMEKFRKNALRMDDPFGYMDQLGFYYTGMVDLPTVTSKDKVAFLACDKEMGHLHLDVYDGFDDNVKEYTRETISHKKSVIASPTPPPRGFMSEPDGKSGNMRLPLECRYCEFKHTCWPGLRTFLYSNGPRFLTKVVKEPDVPEVKK